MQAVIFTYDGWNGLLYFSEEVRDPGRQIPRAMFTGVLAIIAIYVLVNVAFVHVLGMDALAKSDFAAGAAAQALFGARGDTIIRVAAHRRAVQRRERVRRCSARAFCTR